MADIEMAGRLAGGRGSRGLANLFGRAIGFVLRRRRHLSVDELPGHIQRDIGMTDTRPIRGHAEPLPSTSPGARWQSVRL